MKISELNVDQAKHLLWMIDRKTYVGYLTASRIVRGEFGDFELEEVFINAEKKPHIARRYAKQVAEFKVDERSRRMQQEVRALSRQGLNLLLRHEFTMTEVAQILDQVGKFFREQAKSYRSMAAISEGADDESSQEASGGVGDLPADNGGLRGAEAQSAPEVC